MSSGAAVAMKSQGPQDMYLTCNPDMSFAKCSVQRYVNFCMVPTQVQSAGGTSGFNRDILFHIERNADYAWRCYLELTFPQLVKKSVAGSFKEAYVHYVNAVALALLETAEAKLGGQRLDLISGLSIDMFDELMLPSDRSLARLVGKFETRQALIRMSTSPDDEDRTFFIPLIFPNFYLPCNSILLTNSGLTDFKIKIRTACAPTLANAARVSVPTEPTNPTVSNTTYVAVNPYLASNENTQLSQDPPNINLLVYYIFTEKRERAKFVGAIHEVLFLQTQSIDDKTFTQNSSAKHSLECVFSHPCKDIWVVARMENLLDLGNVFNYMANRTDEETNNPSVHYNEGILSPIESISLKFGTATRFSTMSGRYYRDVSSFDFYAKVARKPIYTLSLGYFPTDTQQPSGAHNFSKLDNPVLEIVLRDRLQSGKFTIVTHNYNVLRYVNQMAIPAFST